jgi:hypothetical protein
MHGPIPSVPQYAFKAQGQLYLLPLPTFRYDYYGLQAEKQHFWDY